MPSLQLSGSLGEGPHIWGKGVGMETFWAMGTGLVGNDEGMGMVGAIGRDACGWEWDCGVAHEVWLRWMDVALF